MSYELTGKLIKIGEVQEFGDNGFTKREIVVETGGEWPEQVPFELLKDRTALVDRHEVGDEVTVHFDVGGRYWEGGDRYFVSLKAWRIQAGEGGENVPDTVPGQELPDEEPF